MFVHNESIPLQRVTSLRGGAQANALLRRAGSVMSYR